MCKLRRRENRVHRRIKQSGCGIQPHSDVRMDRMKSPVILLICALCVSACSAKLLTSPSDQAFITTGRKNMLLRRSSRSIKNSKTGLHVTSVVMSRFSRVTFFNKMANAGDEAKEMTFSVRLPEAAFITEFNMVVGGVKFVGKVRAKKIAEEQYQKALQSGNSAGLVSADVRETQTFDVSANVPANSSVEFQLVYQQLLQRKLGKYDHVILVDPRQVVDDFVVDVYITEQTGITSITASSPGIGEKGKIDKGSEGNMIVEPEIRRSKYQAKVTFEPDPTQQRRLLMIPEKERKFTVTYDVTREGLGGEIQMRNGYFVHFFAPEDLPVLPKKVIFVIDRSGSMYGRKMEQTKTAFVSVLKELRDVDKFNVVTFASDVTVWKEGVLVRATHESINGAVEYVEEIMASGSTNFNQGVLEAAELLGNVTKREKTSSMVIVLTDGLPTLGVTNLEKIRLNVHQEVHRRFSVFCLGFGEDLNHDFLNRLANENDGISRRIYEDSDADLQLERFFQEVATPLLMNVKMKYNGAIVSEVSKTKFDKYFGGSEIVVVGAVSQSGKKKMKAVIQGTSIGGKVNYDVKSSEVDTSFEHWFEDTGEFDDFIERMWAYYTIEELLKKKDLQDSREKVENLKNRIMNLAVKYAFVTPLTSMVVTLPQDEITTAVPKTTVHPPIPPCFYRGEHIPDYVIRPPIWCPYIMGARSDQLPGQFIPERSLGIAARSRGPGRSGATASRIVGAWPGAGGGRRGYARPGVQYDSADVADHSGYPTHALVSSDKKPLKECNAKLTVSEHTIRVPKKRTDSVNYCNWEITLPASSWIDLYIESLNTTRNEVKISSEGKGLLHHSSGMASPRYMLVESNQITIEMTVYEEDMYPQGIVISYKQFIPVAATTITKESGPDPGFNPDCVMNITSGANPKGNISSPNYPGMYPNNVLCIWDFVNKDPDTLQLKITFDDMDIEMSGDFCLYDKISVSDGHGWSDTFCGYAAPNDVVSSSESVMLAFITDDKLGASGFSAHYEFTKKF